MRALKLISTLILAAIAVTAGLFVAAAVAVVGLVVFLVARLLGRGTVRINGPHFQRRSPQTQRSPSTAGDAIEVTATEVASEPAGTLPAGSREDHPLRG